VNSYIVTFCLYTIKNRRFKARINNTSLMYIGKAVKAKIKMNIPPEKYSGVRNAFYGTDNWILISNYLVKFSGFLYDAVTETQHCMPSTPTGACESIMPSVGPAIAFNGRRPLLALLPSQPDNAKLFGSCFSLFVSVTIDVDISRLSHAGFCQVCNPSRASRLQMCDR